MKLYVGNLPFHTTEDELRELFSAHGQVEDVMVILDKVTGRSRGFGFVTMGNSQDGQNAIDKLHGAPIGGRNLTVNEARPKEDRPRNFGGGGGGGGGGRREGRGDYHRH